MHRRAINRAGGGIVKYRQQAQLFTMPELGPYRTVREPTCQTEARDRRKVMRKVRSKTKRPLLLADLERRYRKLPEI